MGATARVRMVAEIVLLVVVLAACSYAREEPGLFGRSVPPPAPVPSRTVSVPPPNPDLPVVGDDVWTTADGLGVTVRVAIHAVRRIPGGTVLDWSLTPLPSPEHAVGEVVDPAVDLGLTRNGDGDSNVYLVDSFRRHVHRPLAHAGSLGYCLCTSIVLAQRELVIGQTTLLQITYPPLPPDLSTIDVDVATVPMFWRVPVTPIGMAPVVSSPADLTAPADPSPVLAQGSPFRYRNGQLFVISIDRVVAGNSFTSVQWTIRSATSGPGIGAITGPPFAEDQPSLYNRASASGPVLLAGGRTLRSRQLTTHLQGGAARECLCSDLRAGTAALREPNEAVSVVTTYAALPRGTNVVDLRFPGLPAFVGLPTRPPSDSTVRAAGPAVRQSGTWVYSRSEPPTGWPVNAWPTPLPASDQLRQFTATVDDLVR